MKQIRRGKKLTSGSTTEVIGTITEDGGRNTLISDILILIGHLQYLGSPLQVALGCNRTETVNQYLHPWTEWGREWSKGLNFEKDQDLILEIKDFEFSENLTTSEDLCSTSAF